MKHGSVLLAAAIAPLAASTLFAQSIGTQARAEILRPGKTAAAYSVEVPLVTRTAPSGTDTERTLLLNSRNPFSVTLSARDQRTGRTGVGLALPQNDLFGYFAIPDITSNPSNPEVFVKLLDATSLNGFYWVFLGCLTDLEYTVTLRENSTGRVKTYTKPAGDVRCNEADTAAFSGTPGPPSGVPPPANPFQRTSIDINNNTNKNGVIVRYQFAYTCVSSSCNPVGSFYRTPVQTLTLQALETFHQDDFVQFLDSRGLLVTGAIRGAVGTLLATFDNLDSTGLWEGTIQARTYSRVVEGDPSQGTVGFSYHASPFFESADKTLVGMLRDTRGSPAAAGAARSNLGIRNTDIGSSNQNVTVVLEFYNTATGLRVGNRITLANIQPGELRTVNDVWSAAQIPASVTSVIAFADVSVPTATSPTIEGYLTIVDGQGIQDPAFFELKCADTDPCGN